MRRVTFILLLGIFVGSACSLGDEEDRKCPETVPQWQTFRDDLAKRLKSLAEEERDARPLRSRLLRCMDESTTFLRMNPTVRSCIGKLLDHFRTLGASGPDPDDKGMAVRARKYFEETGSNTALPDILKSSDFLALLNVPDGDAGIERYFAKANEGRTESIEYAIYSSSLTTADEARSPRKLVVLYPDARGKRDLWVQFGLPDLRTRKPTTHTFVLAMKKTGEKYESYFRSYHRMTTRGETALEGYDRHTIGESCTECHKSESTLRLDPKEAREKDRPVVERLNGKMAGYGIAHTDYMLGHLAGPGLGEDGKTRSDEFLETCGGETLADLLKHEPPETREKRKELALQRLRGAMSCRSCHDGTKRGLLNPPMRFIVQRYVNSGRMPPVKGAALSDEEREMLGNCLGAEYYGWRNKKGETVAGLFYSHMTDTSCLPNGKGSAHAGEKTNRH